MSGKAPEPEDSLSATAMFLRAFEANPPQASGESQPPAYSSAPAPPEQMQPPQPASAEPGEFTRMFRAVPTPEPARPTQLTQPASPQGVPPAAIHPPVAGGEFTSAFVVPSLSDSPPLQPMPPKSKGFSTPGLSDSVSTEGSFTRVFQSTAVPPPEPSYPPPAPPATNFPASSWQATPAPNQPPPTAPPPASFTSIFNALGATGEPSEQPHASSPTPRLRPDPTSYPHASPVQRPSTQAMPTGGGITQLINMLSEGPSSASTTRIATPPTSNTLEPPPPADEEFLRIIQPSPTEPALLAQPQSSAQVPTSAPLVLPSAIKPIAPPKLPTPPKLPAVALPTLPPPPRTKLQEMLPLLLVANAFLMLILIVLAVLMLHRK